VKEEVLMDKKKANEDTQISLFLMGEVGETNINWGEE